MSESYTLFHIDGERGFRGGERQLMYLAASLRARGHGSVVACRAGSDLDRCAEAQGLARLNLPFRGEWDPVSAWRLRQAALSAARPVLHAHTGHAAALAFLASAGTSVPVVAHRRVDFRLSGALSARLKYASASRIIAVSEEIRRLLEQDGISADQVSVIPDAVPVGESEARAAGLAEALGPAQDRRALKRGLAARHPGLDAGLPWIGNLAAWVPHKDPQTLLRAAAVFLGGKIPAQFLLIGGGELEAELKGLSAELGIARHVRFLPRQDNPLEWMRALDAYAQSSWGEGMGSVLLEAMACGAPIAATAAGGIPEVLEHERTALLVPPRCPEALAGALKKIFSQPEAALRRAEAARKDLPRFSIEALTDKTLAAYRAAAGKI